MQDDDQICPPKNSPHHPTSLLPLLHQLMTEVFPLMLERMYNAHPSISLKQALSQSTSTFAIHAVNAGAVYAAHRVANWDPTSRRTISNQLKVMSDDYARSNPSWRAEMVRLHHVINDLHDHTTPWAPPYPWNQAGAASAAAATTQSQQNPFVSRPPTVRREAPLEPADFAHRAEHLNLSAFVSQYPSTVPEMRKIKVLHRGLGEDGKLRYTTQQTAQLKPPSWPYGKERPPPLYQSDTARASSLSSAASGSSPPTTRNGSTPKYRFPSSPTTSSISAGNQSTIPAALPGAVDNNTSKD